MHGGVFVLHRVASQTVLPIRATGCHCYNGSNGFNLPQAHSRLKTPPYLNFACVLLPVGSVHCTHCTHCTHTVYTVHGSFNLHHSWTLSALCPIIALCTLLLCSVAQLRVCGQINWIFFVQFWELPVTAIPPDNHHHKHFYRSFGSSTKFRFRFCSTSNIALVTISMVQT